MGPEVVKPPKSATAVISDVEAYIPLASLINIENEQQRLSKEITHLQNQIQSINRKLSNKEFLEKAPATVVERERQKLETFTGKMEKLQLNLSALEIQ